ncbi:hypothetical protein D3C76_1412470 [compost metagenome]
MAEMQAGSLKQIVCLQLLRRSLEHRLGWINGSEAPGRLQRCHRNNLLSRTTRANHQYFRRTRIAQACRQHARSKILAGVIPG